jgi:uncharacterized protein YbaA (DUF1428 family)
MPYIEGFVAAVPSANKAEYVKQAREAVAYFKRLGATRVAPPHAPSICPSLDPV